MRAINRKLLASILRDKVELRKGVAERAGVSDSLLEKLVNGRYKANIKDLTAEAIAKALGVKVDEIFPKINKEHQK